MTVKHGSLVLASYVVLAAVLGPATAATPTPPEYGVRGLRRVELVFMNVGRGGMAGVIVLPDGIIPSTPPNEDLATRVLAKDQECIAIGPTLTREELEVVERCRAEDLACAKLYLTVEDQSSDGSLERIYVIGIKLSQRVQLARDPKVQLSEPTTWSMQRAAVVAADHSATITSCIQLRDMASWFATLWKVGNK